LGGPSPRTFALQSYKRRSSGCGQPGEQAGGRKQGGIFGPERGLLAGREREHGNDHQEHERYGRRRAQHDPGQESQWPHEPANPRRDAGT
jgi:hypothetical protein